MNPTMGKLVFNNFRFVLEWWDRVLSKIFGEMSSYKALIGMGCKGNFIEHASIGQYVDVPTNFPVGLKKCLIIGTVSNPIYQLDTDCWIQANWNRKKLKIYKTDFNSNATYYLGDFKL